ncbi:hypothetical protein MN608_01532 [Microdochium nivale]|nr:hypothetical protein MN608_01532 [Microdochium nivale]
MKPQPPPLPGASCRGLALGITEKASKGPSRQSFWSVRLSPPYLNCLLSFFEFNFDSSPSFSFGFVAYLSISASNTWQCSITTTLFPQDPWTRNRLSLPFRSITHALCAIDEGQACSSPEIRILETLKTFLDSALWDIKIHHITSRQD